MATKAAEMRIRSRLTDPGGLWRLRVPIASAPMAGAAGGALAAAAARAGALGFVAVGHGSDLAALRKEVALFRAEAPPSSPLALGFIGYSAASAEGVLAQVLAEHSPQIVQFFAPAVVGDGENIRAAKAAGALVVAQVGSVADAREAIAVGVDGLIAQGREAGGHGLRSELGTGTLPLAAAVVQEAARAEPRPVVLAAGGIADGRGLAAMLALGCDGAVLGTRLWASREAMGSDRLKAELLQASGDDVMRTRVFDTIQNATSPVPWPAPYDSVGALKNSTTEAWHGRQAELEAAVASEDSELLATYKAASAAADPAVAVVLAGEGVGLVESLDGAEEIVLRVEQEAVEALEAASRMLAVDAVEASSM